MSLNEFLQRVKNGERVSFSETQQVISSHYRYRPTRFSNGLEGDRIINEAGMNEGSCKIFSFASIHRLEKDATLSLFGDYYWTEVLQDPSGSSHGNIRNFMRYGWKGIHFERSALSLRERE